HACGDAEDEAQRAAACVVQRVAAGQVPVALLANDRLLTRRVSALLTSAGVAVRDETGWKLSTTHAAAQVMALLRAADPRASMDEALDALKLSPRWGPSEALALEVLARRHGVSRWAVALGRQDFAPMVPMEWSDALAQLQGKKELGDWLQALARALELGGWWAGLLTDAAGQQILKNLRLYPGAATELLALGLSHEAVGGGSAGAVFSALRWSLSAFTAWVSDVLEGASFTLPAADQAPVVILPMAQQVGRAFGSVVVPGCDERTLPTHPELPAPWTAPQREFLGMPGREALAQAASQAWQAALQYPPMDVLWRTQDRGEEVLPNAWVLALQRSGAIEGSDPRAVSVSQPVSALRPAPSAPSLLPERLSASAYQDLRDCPYKFFALRQLRLHDADEMESEPDQRDMGNWLHAVL
ncbi:MAG: PD-(D/E)XK nuclease family protein, partial [Hydrogenophaga sp.]